MDKKMPKTATYQEIITQTEAWKGALQAVSNRKEFRHGPMSLVTETSLIISLLSDNNRHHEQALDDMAQLGSRVLSIGEMDNNVTFNSRLPESIRIVLYLPVPQLMAYYRSIAKGFNPDQPHYLTAVVKLNLN